MKTLTTTIGAVLLATGTTHAGLSGTVDYSFELSSNTAVVGDTVTVTVVADVLPDDQSYFAFAQSFFDILVTDMPGGGHLGAYGATPDFLEGSIPPGTIVGSNIVGNSVGQLPVALDPVIDTGTHLELFNFEYVVDDASARLIAFDLAGVTSNVYTGSGLFDPVVGYGSNTSTAFLEVTEVPAPGAMALLAAAGVVSGRRRRRDEA